MSLKAARLPLEQVDQSLCDVRLYVKMLAEAKRIKSATNRAMALYVIDCAYENANDTIMLERVTDTTWADMFYGSVGCMLSDRTLGASHHTFKWFASRDFQW